MYPPNGTNGEWWVDRIRGHRYIQHRIQYLVTWLGYPGEDSWEKLDNLAGCPRKLAAYHKYIGHKPYKTAKANKCRFCHRKSSVSP